jgi:hypothetical protein
VKSLSPRKPSHAFPSQARPSNDHRCKPSKLPGPGEYFQPGRATTGPQWSFTPRRPQKMHPLMKTALRPLPALPQPRRLNAIMPGA